MKHVVYKLIVNSFTKLNVKLLFDLGQMKHIVYKLAVVLRD